MSFQANKTDAALGIQIEAMLHEKGLQTPTTEFKDHYTFEKRKQSIEDHFRGILQDIGMDLSDDSLEETPTRMAKMYLNEVFWGLRPENFPKVTVVDNKMKYSGMVLERRIQVSSTCEHHLLPIIGWAHVAYIPTDKVPGLSKINRIVEYFSRRPQIQERLTTQIHETLCHILGTRDVAVTIDAEHMCVKTRGVEDACSDTVTPVLGGVFLDTAVRAEYFSLINLNR